MDCGLWIVDSGLWMENLGVRFEVGGRKKVDILPIRPSHLKRMFTEIIQSVLSLGLEFQIFFGSLLKF